MAQIGFWRSAACVAMVPKYAEKQAKTGSLDLDQNPLDVATDEDDLRTMELELAILKKKRALAQKSSSSSSSSMQSPIDPSAAAKAPQPPPPPPAKVNATNAAPPKRNCVAPVVTMQSRTDFSLVPVLSLSQVVQTSV